MTANWLLAIIFIPLVLFKILRVTNFIIFMVKYKEAISASPPGPEVGLNGVATFQIFWNTSPYAKIEWFMEVFDNWYVS